MDEVIVEYDYTAKEPDELTIKKGDIIKDVVKKQGGWWEGILKDKKGMFPDNFVRPLDKDSSVILRNKKDVSRIRQCRVVFSYHPHHEDELNLKVGDIINVVGEEEEGWWRGLLNGKEGVFPSNFVEEITLPPKPVSREETGLAGEAEVTPPKLPSKPSKQYCEVKYPYKALNEDELNLKEGDIVLLVSKESQDPGWWKGEINGKIGVFPDNFVALIPAGEEKSSGKDEKKSKLLPTETGAIKSSSVASQRKSLEVKHDVQQEKPTTESSGTPSNKTNPPIPGKKPTVSIKKSPSGSGASLFSDLRKKLVDVVDGGAGSKSSSLKAESSEGKNSSAEAFDQVERGSLLTDMRRTRAKAPGRRLPTSLHKDDDHPNIPNGNVDHLTDTSDSSLNTSSLNNTGLSTTSPNTSSSTEVDGEKPRLREWEKHKAPWLEEMKLNQAKRTSTSPGPPAEGKIKLTPTGDKSEEDRGSPVEKEVDMSKSMPSLDLTKSLAANNKLKTPPSESDKSSLIKTKPTIPSSINARPPIPTSTSKDTAVSYRHTVSITNTNKDPASIKAAAPLPPKVSPVAPMATVVTTTKNSPTIAQKTEKDRMSGEFQEPVTHRQYSELLERIQKLEALVDKQNQSIEELKSKLQVETDMRMLLQEKVMQNVQV